MSQTVVGVIGCGIMGAGIVEVAATRGCPVVGVDADAGARERAAANLRRSLEREATAGRLTDAVDDVLSRVTFTAELADLAPCDVVIEAVIEREKEKVELFSQLGDHVSADCLLATNTSSIPVTRIAAATTGPERVVGLHFFNPVPRMPLVEVVSTPLTGDGVVERAEAFVREVLGKRSILAKDRSGFVVNVLLVPYLLSSMRLYDNGLASADDIDDGMQQGCGMPMGPLRLSDMIGLDTLLLVADSLYAEHLDAQFAAPPVLRRLVDAGWYGRKTGRGFHAYV